MYIPQKDVFIELLGKYFYISKWSKYKNFYKLKKEALTKFTLVRPPTVFESNMT